MGLMSSDKDNQVSSTVNVQLTPDI